MFKVGDLVKVNGNYVTPVTEGATGTVIKTEGNIYPVTVEMDSATGKGIEAGEQWLFHDDELDQI